MKKAREKARAGAGHKFAVVIFYETAAIFINKSVRLHAFLFYTKSAVRTYVQPSARVHLSWRRVVVKYDRP